MRKLIENFALEMGAVPIDTTGAAVVGDYVSMKNYQHLTIVIAQGAWAGGTPAVTLVQATDVSGTSAKALSFTERWSQVAITGTGLTRTAVTSDTFNLTATANTMTVIEVDAEMLDAANDFDCVRVNIATPGANADLVAVFYALSGARHRNAAPMPDPKVDA